MIFLSPLTLDHNYVYPKDFFLKRNISLISRWRYLEILTNQKILFVWKKVGINVSYWAGQWMHPLYLQCLSCWSSWVFCGFHYMTPVPLVKVILNKSCGKLFLLVQCTTCTFEPVQSYDYIQKNWKFFTFLIFLK